MHDTSLDTIDRLLEQGKALKTIAQLNKEVEDLTSAIKEASVDDPVNILKEIIANLGHPEKLSKKYIESGLYDKVEKLIGTQQYIRDNFIRMMERAEKAKNEEDDE